MYYLKVWLADGHYLGNDWQLSHVLSQSLIGRRILHEKWLTALSCIISKFDWPTDITWEMIDSSLMYYLKVWLADGYYLGNDWQLSHVLSQSLIGRLILPQKWLTALSLSWISSKIMLLLKAGILYLPAERLLPVWDGQWVEWAELSYWPGHCPNLV